MRTDREIVDQTHRLAREFARMNSYVIAEDIDCSAHPDLRVQAFWAMACKAQEILTGTEVENAIANMPALEIWAPDHGIYNRGWALGVLGCSAVAKKIGELAYFRFSEVRGWVMEQGVADQPAAGGIASDLIDHLAKLELVGYYAPAGVFFVRN